MSNNKNKNDAKMIVRKLFFYTITVKLIKLKFNIRTF